MLDLRACIVFSVSWLPVSSTHLALSKKLFVKLSVCLGVSRSDSERSDFCPRRSLSGDQGKRIMEGNKGKLSSRSLGAIRPCIPTTDPLSIRDRHSIACLRSDQSRNNLHSSAFEGSDRRQGAIERKVFPVYDRRVNSSSHKKLYRLSKRIENLISSESDIFSWNIEKQEIVTL